MAVRVPGWLERVLLPQLNELKGELRAMNARIDGEFRSIHSEIRRVDGKIDSLDRRLEAKVDSLDKRMDMTQRGAAFEERIREFEAKK
jgi:Skp family chaperone for outer membrane proteins